MYGLVERTVRGDGNCQFRALADQLYRSEDMHADVRRTVVHQLRAFSEVRASVVVHIPPRWYVRWLLFVVGSSTI